MNVSTCTIPGAGARLNKHKLNDDTNKTNWRDRDNRSDNTALEWSSKSKNDGTGWTEPKKNTKINKGWEHDDRFQNDYS